MDQMLTKRYDEGAEYTAVIIKLNFSIDFDFKYSAKVEQTQKSKKYDTRYYSASCWAHERNWG